MTALLRFIPGWAWAGIISTALMAAPLIAVTAQLGEVRRDRDRLAVQITDPATGYIVRLVTCRLNAGALEGSIAAQNEAVEALEREASARLNRAARAAEAAQRQALDARERWEAVLAQPLTGETTCERVEDADRRFMEGLG